MKYLADLEELMAGFLEKRRLIGVGLALIQEGEIVHLAGYGRTRWDEAGVPLSADTLFAGGSVCKTICAALMMRLVERGLLALDAPLYTYLPALRFSHPAWGRRITLRHVLSHTTGLPAWSRTWGPAGPRALFDTPHAEIPHYRFLAPPGTFHLYSNVAFSLAGAAAEAVTGQSYADLAAEHVFAPLAMRRATFDLAVAITRPMALPHRREGDDVAVLPRLPHNDAAAPASSGFSSTLDLAQLACMVLNRGQVAGQSFLSTDSVEEMSRRHAQRHVESAAHPLALAYGGYGLGMQTGRYETHPMVRHGGATAGTRVFFDLFPKQQCGVVAQITYLDETAAEETAIAAWDVILEQPPRGVRLAPAPCDAPSPSSPFRSGRYLNVERGNMAEIERKDGQTELAWEGNRGTIFTCGSDLHYANLPGRGRVPVRLLPEQADTPPTVLIFGNPYQRVTAQAEKERWERLTGRFRDPFNHNPAEILAVTRDAEGLLLTANGRSATLEPVTPHTFLSPLGVVDVPPDDGGPAGWIQIGRAARYYRAD